MDCELRRLIVDYLQNVDLACDLLRQRLNISDNILEAWMSRSVRQEGWLDDDRRTSYSFHGIGCCVRFGEKCVDFDFGPGGRHDGFDAWRLALFADSIGCREPRFADYNLLQQELDDLLANGEIVRLTNGLGAHLRFFPSSTTGDRAHAD